MSSLRMPQSLSRRLGNEPGEAVLHYELLEEQAHSRGQGRAAVLKAAADAVWGFLVQREVMGLRDRAQVIAQYGIPREVLARLGAR